MDHELLAQQLSGFARRLEAEDDPELMLDEVVRAAVALIPGVEEGRSVSWWDAGR